MVSYHYLKQVYKETQSDNHYPFWLPAIHNSVYVPTVHIIFNIGTTEHAKLTLKLEKSSSIANMLNRSTIIKHRNIS